MVRNFSENTDKTQVELVPLAPVALVTGGARRIGAAIIERLHQSGFQIVLHCHHSIEEANQLAKILNGIRPESVVVMQADLSKPKEVDSVMEGATQWRGRLNLLVNNASLFKATDFLTLNTAAYEELYAVNVFAPWRLSIKARPWLAATKGNIINITDIHAEKPLKGYAEYCQSKAALWMQTKALAREFAPDLRVNAVAPGAIIWPEADNTLSATMKEKIIASTPLRQHGQPQFVAEAVLALIANAFITGQVLRVDGGRSI